MSVKAAQAIEFVRGDQFDLPMIYRNPGGPGIDLTGASIKGLIRWSAGSMELTVGNGRIVMTDAEGGSFKLSIQEVDTATLPEGRVSTLSIILTDSFGDVRTLKIIPLVGVTP